MLALRCCVFAALMLLHPASAISGPCILPVQGEEPLSDVEAEQPYRLATDPITLPGYKGLLVRPLNRPDDSNFYEITGRSYRRIPMPAPGSTYLDSESLPVSGGAQFLLGWAGRVVWHLPEGSDTWQDAAPGQTWWGYAYDPGAQDLYLSFGPGSPILRWDGTAFVPAGPMPTVYLDAVSRMSADVLPAAILSLPKAGGTFAIARALRNENWRSLWFRPFGGDWTLIADKLALDKLVPGSSYPGPFHDADVSDDGQTVRLFAGHPREASVLLRKTANGWALDSAAPYQSWVSHRSSGVRLAWIGESQQDLTAPFLLFFTRPVTPVPPVLHALDPGTLTPRPLPGIAPTLSETETSVLYLGSIKDFPGLEPLLVRADVGWHAFDGTTLTGVPALRTDAVGHIASVGPLVLMQSPDGVFVLDKTLTSRHVASFPVAEPRISTVEIVHIAAAQLFVAVERRSATVYVSNDFESFRRVISPTPITRLVAQLPDRPGLLLVGADGLYTFEADCPAQGD